MAEKIGLVAELDMNAWDAAVRRYLYDVMNMNNQTTSIAGQIGAAYTQLGGVITTALAGVTLAVAGIASLAGKELVDWTVEGVKAAAEYEQGMANIAAVLRKTREEVEPLANLIDELALDPQLVVGTEDASAAVERLARNGIEMTDILDGAALATILLANATGGDFSKSADVATMAMKMFNLEADELNKIADISQGVINNSRIELNDWKLGLGNAGAAAATFGVSLEDFATALVGTVDLFHSTRQAGTGLANFLLRTVPITRPAADEMRKLGLFSGLTSDEFDKLAGEIADTEAAIQQLDPNSKNYATQLDRLNAKLREQRMELNAGQNAFFDQNGNLKDLAEVSDILSNAISNLSDEQQVQALRVIFGNDALETAIGMARLAGDEFETLRDKVYVVGSAAEAAATRTDTLAARWENLGDIWEAIQRRSGASFDGMLRNIVEILTELTDQHGERVVMFFSNMATAIDKIVMANIPWIEEQLPVLLDNIEALAYWLAAAALEGGLWNSWLTRMSPGLRELIENTLRVKDETSKLADKIGEAIDKVKEFFQPLSDWIFQNVELKDVILAAAGAVVAFLAPLGMAIARMAAVGAAATVAVSLIRTAWEEDFAGIRTVVTTVWDDIEDSFTEFLGHLSKGEWSEAWEAAKQTALQALESIEQFIPTWASGIITVLRAALEGDWDTVWDTLGTAAKTAFDYLKTNMPIWIDTAVTAVKIWLEKNWPPIWNTTKTTVKTIFDELGLELPESVTTLMTTLKTKIDTLWPPIWKGAKPAIDELIDLLKTDLPAAADAGIDLIDGYINEDWRKVWDSASTIFNTALDAWKISWEGLRETFKSLGNAEDIAPWQKEMFKSFYALSGAIESFISLWLTLTNFLTTTEERKESLIGWITEDLPNAFNKAREELFQFLQVAGGMFEIMFKQLETFNLRTQLATNLFSPERRAEIQAQIDENLRIIEELEAEIKRIASENVDEMTGIIREPFNQLETQLTGQGQKIEEILRLSGRNSITAFTDAFVNADSGTAIQAITGFYDDIMFIVDSVPDLYRNAGYSSIEEYVAGVAERRGVAEEAAHELAKRILDSHILGIEANSPMVSQKMGDTITGSIADSKAVAEEASLLMGKDVTKAYGDGITEGKPTAEEAWNAAINSISEKADELPPQMTEVGQETVENLVKPIREEGPTKAREGFNELEQAIAEWAANFLVWMKEEGASTLQEWINGLTEKIPELSQIQTLIQEQIQLWVDFLLLFMKELGSKMFASFIEGIVESMPTLTTTLEGIKTEISTWITDLLGYMEDSGIFWIFRFTKGIKDSASTYEEALTGIRTSTETWITDLLGYMEDSGIFWVYRFVKGMKDTQSSINEFLQDVKSDIEAWVTELLNDMEQAGQEMVQKMADGARSNSDAIPAVFRDIKTRVISEINSLISEAVSLFSQMASQMTASVNTSQFSQLGTNMGSSFVSGLQSQVGAAQAAAQQLVDAAAVAAAASAQIASPSKRFHKLGSQAGEGLVIGWEEQMVRLENLVSSSVGGIAGILGSWNQESRAGGINRFLSDSYQSLQGQFSSLRIPSQNSSYSYQTVHSPISIGPININNVMDQAEFEYRVEQVINRARTG